MKLILSSIIISMIFTNYSSARQTKETVLQSHDSVLVLKAVNWKSHDRSTIKVGDNVRYKTHTLDAFVKGRITEITSSSISFQNKKMENVTIAVKEISALMIKRSLGVVIFGSVALCAGTFSLFLAAQFPPLVGPWFIYAVPGTLGVVNGLVLTLTKRKIDLENTSWKLGIIKVPLGRR